ncbi:uncharacterized protein LOC144169474 [Haemaphysalis longicornis]
MKASLWLTLLPLAMAAVQSPQEEVTNTGSGCVEQVSDAQRQHCAATRSSVPACDLLPKGLEDSDEELKKVLHATVEVARLSNMAYTDLDQRLIARLAHYKMIAFTDAEAENVPGPWKNWGTVKVVCNPSRFEHLTTSRNVIAGPLHLPSFTS